MLLYSVKEGLRMEIRKLISLTLLTIFSSSCVSNEYSFKEDTDKVKFKNFTLAVCMNMAYGESSDALLKEASLAANGYREFSNIDLSAYEASRSLISKWLNKDYASKNGGQINLMKCIDLYNSPALENLFIQYDPCKNKESWLDQDEYIKHCA